MSATENVSYRPIYTHPQADTWTFEAEQQFQTLSATMGTGGGNVPLLMETKTYRKQGHPQNAEQGQGWEETEKNDTLNVYDNAESRTPTLIVGGEDTSMNTEHNINAVVRRLTPLECERLQGYPDGWTDIGEWVDSKGKKHKEADTPRYKALGNSIALPYWEWLAKRVVKSLGDEDLTMGSLFDGIGGFPLAFSRAGVEPIWASEIEEFPIAVTKRRFPNAEKGNETDKQDIN